MTRSLDLLARRLASPVHRLGFWLGDLQRQHGYLLRRPILVAARWYLRAHGDVPLIVVSGSAGKTTTRGIIAAILRQRFSIIETEGNHNADVVLPRYLFRVRRRERQMLVLEAGIKTRRNAPAWNRMVAPDVVVLTSIGDTHLSWLGDRDGVLREKLSLARNLKPGGHLVVNADDPHLMTLRGRPDVVTFGLAEGADFVARNVRLDATGVRFEVVSATGVLSIESPLLGEHHVRAILGAVACASLFGATAEDIREGLAAFRPEPRRVQVIERNGWTLIDDAYSANPQSVRAALAVQALFPGRKILVLGDMLELGVVGPELHRELGRELARSYPYLTLLAYGPLAALVAEEATKNGFAAERTYATHNKLDLLLRLNELFSPGDVVLFKGSRGARLEEVLERVGDAPCVSPLESMQAPKPIGEFGARRDEDRLHEGIDLSTPEGTPVRAFADGRISFAGFEPLYGNVIRIAHFTNIETVYAHLSRILVRRGKVRRGQEIARSGRSGIFHTRNDADYPHLHFEVRVARSPVDPTRYFPELATRAQPTRRCEP